MEYTVNGLARLAGVSVRTLHWYDEIGLLRPARVTEAGYRMYGPDEVDALQSILFYRALGVPLKQIGALMADASAGRLAALQSHRAALLCRRAQLDALLATLDKTILTEEGKCAMTDSEKFEGFKQKLVAENEAEYGAEARGKYGDTAVDASNAKLMGLSPEQYGEMQKLSARINAALAAAVRAGEAPDGPEGRRIAELHKQWLCFTWPKYTPKAHLGLAEMYVADERFTAYYDAETPGCAAFFAGRGGGFHGLLRRCGRRGRHKSNRKAAKNAPGARLNDAGRARGALFESTARLFTWRHLCRAGFLFVCSRK